MKELPRLTWKEVKQLDKDELFKLIDKYADVIDEFNRVYNK